VRRYLRGTLHYGKTALLAATVAATFLTPLFPNLDVAFQGINGWHCIQYLALIWYANRVRADRGEVELGFVRSISAKGIPGFLRYYLSSVAGTVLIIGIVFGLAALARHFGITTLGAGQHKQPSEMLVYYMIGKGLLLTHYYYDTFLFTQRDELSAPGAAARGPDALPRTGRRGFCPQEHLAVLTRRWWRQLKRLGVSCFGATTALGGWLGGPGAPEAKLRKSCPLRS
jgi:hypothetical protein